MSETTHQTGTDAGQGSTSDRPWRDETRYELCRRKGDHGARATRATILLVDDAPSLGLLVRMLGRRANCQVHCCEDLSSARLFLDASVPAIAPDLILLDRNLTGEDGLQLVKDLRQSEFHATIPVALFGHENLSEDLRAGLEAGIDYFFLKDLVSSSEAWCQRLHEILDHARASLTLKQTAGNIQSDWFGEEDAREGTQIHQTKFPTEPPRESSSEGFPFGKGSEEAARGGPNTTDRPGTSTSSLDGARSERSGSYARYEDEAGADRGAPGYLARGRSGERARHHQNRELDPTQGVSHFSWVVAFNQALGHQAVEVAGDQVRGLLLQRALDHVCSAWSSQQPQTQECISKEQAHSWIREGDGCLDADRVWSTFPVIWWQRLGIAFADQLWCLLSPEAAEGFWQRLSAQFRKHRLSTEETPDWGMHLRSRSRCHPGPNTTSHPGSL